MLLFPNCVCASHTMAAKAPKFSPPGFQLEPSFTLTSPFMSPHRAEPCQDWLTPAGVLRQDLDTHHNVAQFEAVAMKFAWGQTSTLMQTLFFMWMIGSQLSLFSMIFLVQGGFTPFLSILRVNQGEWRSARRAPGRPAAQLTGPPPLPHIPPSLPTPPAFAQFALPGVNTTVAKALYIAVHAVGCFFICWKLKALGILPITSADWVSLIPPKRFTDFSS